MAASRLLLPRGAVILWEGVGAPVSVKNEKAVAAALGDRSRTASGIDVSPSQRTDWAAGRDLAADEARMGMLTTVAQAAIRQQQQSSQGRRKRAADAVQLAPPRLNAVIKADVGDWQVNEIGYDGDTTLLTRRPKGRWLKVTKDQTEKVETDDKQDFNLPWKSFDERIVNYGYYRKIVGPMPAGDRPVLQLSLYRENTAWSVVRSRAHYRARVQPDVLDVASPKESFGCVTQLVSAIRVPRDILTHVNRHYNLNAIMFNPLKNGGPEAIVDGCLGNSWRLLLRCVTGSREDVDETVDRLQRDGFINYFPASTFGLTANAAHETASAAARGDFRDACRFWLQSEAERNPVLHRPYLEYINTVGASAVGGVEAMARNVRGFRMQRRLGPFLDVLREATTDGSVADRGHELWGALTWEDRSALLSAAPAFVWNAMASQRLLSHGPRVVAGDVVLPPPNVEGGEDGSATGPAPHVVQPGEESAFDIADVVLPLPPSSTSGAVVYPETNAVNRDLYQRFTEQHQLGPAIAEWHATALASAPVYRPLIVRPLRMKWTAVEDVDSLALLKTDRFLREERKPVGTGLESGRLRQPTPLQVPVALRERMQPVLHDARSGSMSVAMTFELPAGSHPTVLLREGFNVRHVNFSDLLTPVPVDGMRVQTMPPHADDERA